MKRKNLLLTLLLALLVPWAANAQETKTVYVGTTTNNYVPMYGGYFDDFTKSEFVIPADSIAIMDGGQITAMKFYISAVSSYGSGWGDTHQVVFLKEVESTTLSAWSGMDDATIVFDGMFTVPAANDTEFEITFTTNYQYNGGNLLVGIYNTDDGGYRGVTWLGQTATGASGGASNGTSLNSVSFSQRNFIPTTTFTYEPAASDCPKVNNLVASNVTAHTADLSWQSESGDYLVQYKKATDPESEYWNCNPGYLGYYANTESFQLTGLEAETEYNVRVAAWWETCPIDPETGDPGYSDWKTINITTAIACPAPTGLYVNNITRNSAVVNWTGEGNFVLQYAVQIRANLEVPELQWITIENATSPQTITDLDPSTDYAVRVKKVCGGIDGESVWTESSFTTDEACPTPSGLTATPYAYSAVLDWQGTSDSYTVSYRTAAYTDGVEEGFSSSPAGWSFKTGALNADGTATLSGNTSWSRSTGNGVFDTHIYMNMYSTKNYWLITPSMEIQDGYALSLDMAYTAYSGTQGAPALNCSTHRFVILISIDDMQHWTILREWNNSGSEYVLDAIPTSGQNSGNIDLSAYAGQTAYIAFFGHSEVSNYDNNFHFDNVAIGIAMPAGEWMTVTVDEAAATITGLTPGTKYEWNVQGDCGDWGMSEESATMTFTTSNNTCPMPTNLAVNAETLTATTANLSWKGSPDVESFTVRYRTPEHLVGGLSETFDNTSVPAGWTRYSGLVDDVVAGTATLSSTSSGWLFDNTNVFGQYHAKVNIYGTSCKYWLVTPEVTPSNGTFTFDLALTDYYNANPIEDPTAQDDDRFVVLVYANDAWTILREWNNSGSAYVYNTIATEGEAVSIDLSAYVGQTVKIAFYGESTVTSNGDNDLHIDNVVIGNPQVIPATEWQTVTTTDMNVTLTGLTPETPYEAQVKSDCSDPEEWSTAISFTTVAIKRFVTAGFWNEPNNWSPVGVPTIYDDVIIAANDTIPSGVVAEANMITFATVNDTLVIANGGQLVTNNNVEQAKVIMRIKGWDSPGGTGTEVNQEEDDLKVNDINVNRFFLITNPLNTLNGNPVDYGMITNPAESYDFYTWDYEAEDDLEWRNYKLQDPLTFSMANGTGYLYANINSMDLVFPGTVRANDVTETVQLEYTVDGNYDFNGWNLLGNPFMCNVYIDQPYYRMNETGWDIILADMSQPIAPMEGFFVQATNEGQSINISREASAKCGHLNMNLTSGRSVMDKAIITFGEGSKLGKFQLNANRSKVYMTQDGKDYAVLSADNQNEIPVSFKAGKNDTYTLSFTTEEISLGYLHLIDNMTGADVDLLQTPSYTFEARTTDYASRFRLVFSADSNSNESNFAFFNNGNLIINNEGNATLQVIDVMGHILSSETINGSASINVNAAAGVYMIRLINGENVKVQKVIIK